MAVQLSCVDRDHKGELWSLDLDRERVVVRDASGAPVAEFTPEEAVGRFQMPSFSENVKHFGIQLESSIFHFAVPKDGLREIKALINRTIVASGPEAILSIRNRAIRDTLVGLVCAVGGVVLTVGSYVSAANKPQGGEYTITYGLVLFGFAIFCKGVYGLIQYGQVRSLAES
ncbi:hypothetical protein V5E97_21495 [Singulisphaera sp. Ch08]|uniref:Uncharacterized protein n=1 Tax=Singulisphaera sp. Ch08 TaxID=3120278 RepID=A0AAU7C6X7_9BACT